MFLANEKLNLSFHTKNGGEDCFASAFLLDIAKFMNVEIEDESLRFNEVQNNLLELNKDNVIINNFNKTIAKENLLHNIKLFESYKDNKNYLKHISTIYNSLNDEEIFNNIHFDNRKTELVQNNFLSTGKCGISQFEKFFRCPYMHYVDYGLKLTEAESDEVRAFEIGNIIHEFLKVVVPNIVKDSNLEEQYVVMVLDKILASETYQHMIKNKGNAFLVRDLYNECKRITRVIKNVSMYSSFKPEMFEYSFVNNDLIDTVINGKSVKLVGVIDRVDKINNKFIVVDYKTGNAEFSDYTDVKYGKKIQLIVYMLALCDKNSMVPVGAFYMPISNGFTKNEGNELFKFKGIINKEECEFTEFDKRLNEIGFNSDIINVGTDKNGLIKQNNNYYKNLCVNNDELFKLFEYVKQLINDGVKRMICGEIEPRPLAEGNRRECDYCKYKGMCNFNTKYLNNEIEMKKVSSISELCGEDDNE